jgi:hypothetical protein
MSNVLGGTLKPYLHPHVKPVHRNAYIAFFHASSRTCLNTETRNESLWSSLSYQRRLKALKNQRPVDEDPEAFPSVLYPRIKEPAPELTRVTTGFVRPSNISKPTPDHQWIRPRMTFAGFKKKYDYIEPGASCEDPITITLYGKTYHGFTRSIFR